MGHAKHNVTRPGGGGLGKKMTKCNKGQEVEPKNQNFYFKFHLHFYRRYVFGLLKEIFE